VSFLLLIKTFGASQTIPPSLFGLGQGFCIRPIPFSDNDTRQPGKARHSHHVLMGLDSDPEITFLCPFIARLSRSDA
jgi:hypothetical protein